MTWPHNLKVTIVSTKVFNYHTFITNTAMIFLMCRLEMIIHKGMLQSPCLGNMGMKKKDDAIEIWKLIYYKKFARRK